MCFFINVICMIIFSSVNIEASLIPFEEKEVPCNEKVQISSFSAAQDLTLPDISDFQAKLSQEWIENPPGNYIHSSNAVLDLYAKFEELDAPDGIWEKLAKKINAYRWAAQKNWKEVVGGHLFFSAQQIEKWLEVPSTSHLVERSDMLWRYAAALRFNHPLGAFYLARSFYKLTDPLDDFSEDGTGETWKDRLRGKAKDLLLYAFKDLSLLTSLEEGEPHATYSVGEGLTEPYFSALREIFCSSAQPGKYLSALPRMQVPHSLFTKGNDLKNKVSLLVERGRNKDLQQPVLEEFFEIADGGYFPAYLQAYRWAQETCSDQAEAILDQAIEKGYGPAFLSKAYFYRNKGDLKKSIEFFQQAAQHNIAQGYTELANLLAKKEYDLPSLKPLKEEYYQKAARLFSYEGYLNLGKYYTKLGDLQNSASSEKRIYYGKAKEAWYKGYQLGDFYCFQNVCFFLKKYSDLFTLEQEQALRSINLHLYEYLINSIFTFIDI